MKKITFALVLTIVPSILALAQIRKGDILLSLSGSYDESHLYNGVSVSSLSAKTKSLSGAISGGLALSNSFAMGVGLGYDYGKTDQEYYSSQDEVDNDYLTLNNSKTVSHIISPTLFAKYYKKVMPRIYIGFNFDAAYGFADTKLNSLTYFITAPVPSGVVSVGTPSVHAFQSDESNSFRVLNLSLQPEVNCFVTRRLGLSMRLGGMSYTSTSEGEHEWHISLNPGNWQYGLFWVFPR